MAFDHGGPWCNVTVYPYKLGACPAPYDLAALSVTTTNSVRQPASFSVTLPPSGPQGLARGTTWSDLIPPMSSVNIAMGRNTQQSLVMAGVAESTSTITDRRFPGAGPQRVSQITGTDFSYFFNQQNYYCLYALLGMGAGALGASGVLATTSDGLLGGTPDQIAAAWYDKTMANGLLSKTQIAGPQSAMFKDVMATWFEPFNGPAQIPTAANFLADEDTWMGKFQTFFPWPWYELFCVTAPVGCYPSASKPAFDTSAGQVSGNPIIVARINPFPTLTKSSGKLAVDSMLWSALPVYRPNLSSETPMYVARGRDLSGVRNFFMSPSTALTTLTGVSNGNRYPFSWTQNAWADIDSIRRYGYRPFIGETRWFVDLTGSAGRANASSPAPYDQLVAQMTLRMAAQSLPAAVMEQGSLMMELRPDIQPGSIFETAVYGDGEVWQFYVETVTHNWTFGQGASTTLQVSRGLPKYVYQNSDLLLAVLTGRADWQNGVVAVNDSLTGLQEFTAQVANDLMRSAAASLSQTNPG